MIPKYLPGVLCCILLAGGQTFADDAALAWGGNPKALSGHPSIRMDSEKIKLVIGRKWTSVTCAFVFKNDGPACKVRMGFPDIGSGAYETAATEHEGDGKIYSALTAFQSFVDGKKVSCTLVKGQSPDGAALNWHEKTVDFKRKQTIYVLDQYKVRTGVAITADDKTSINEVGYIMHTGSSWKGPIGKATVLAQFEDGVLPDDIKILPARNLRVKLAEEYKDWDKVKPNEVYTHGFATPTVDGANVLFVAKDLKPTKKSDVYLYFRTPDHAKSAKTPHKGKKRRERKPKNTVEPTESEE